MGKPSDTLDALRVYQFFQKVSSSTVAVKPHNLPPTSAAAKYHSLRVYHQVQQWQGVDLSPEDWGWKLVDGKLRPIMTDRPVAPKHLLDAIHCSCSMGCKTHRCSCRKYGLSCSSAGGECRGLSCQNAGSNTFD